MSELMFADKIIFTHGEASLPHDSGVKLDKSRTCCFTGHRPEKLPVGEEYEKLKEKVRFYVRLLVMRGFDTFITGMSRGFDLMAADILLNDGQVRGKVDLICAVPYRAQIDEMNTEQEREIYCEAIGKAKAIVVFFNSCQDGCYKVRNQFMIDHSSVLVGYLKKSGSRHSGSAQTVNMANRAGLEKFIIYGDEISRHQ
ncbi:MAG: SLOG family protein [Oscillospiraceae bacterium]